MKNLLCVDGNSILNRSFYGIRPLTNAAGLHTNALYGFCNVLMGKLETLQPAYAVVAFDRKEPTFRHKAYADYKAGRRPMPQELLEQFPYAKACAEALGFTVAELAGYEADDILGTVAQMACAADVHSYLLTGDRDALQLIGPKSTVLLATNRETVCFDTTKFHEEYGIDASQFVQVKALMGDASDHIPGVPGIGEKTALKLVAQYGTLEEIYAALADAPIPKGQKEKLLAGQQSAFDSRYLATICRDAPLPFTLEEATYTGMHTDKLRALFAELSFSVFLRRLPKEQTDIPEKSEVEMQYMTPQVFAKQQGQMAVWIAEDDTVYAAGPFATHGVCLGPFMQFAPLFAQRTETLIVYDAKHFYHRMDAAGYSVRNVRADVLLGAYVLDAAQGGFSPERLVLQYLKEPLASCGSGCAVQLYTLWGKIEMLLREQSAFTLYQTVELPLAAVLCDMEKRGFHIDCTGLRDFGEQLGALCEVYAERIYCAAGMHFNILSPKQLAEVLYDRLGLPCRAKTKTGRSTSAEVLERLKPYYPIVNDILEYRQVAKLKSTYADGLLKVADAQGCVHSTFHQTVTATGRLSSSEPNLQNIPIRTELGRELRRFFLPAAENRVLIDADYSQIELRLLAAVSQDSAMLSAFENGVDIHTATASTVFGVPPEQVSREERKRAKAVNFGIVYGIGDFSLSQDLGITKKEAGEYIASYLSAYPGVAAYLKDVVCRARESGYVTTLFGRRRYIPELSSPKKQVQAFGERVAMNSPIQGTAADIIKMAMIAIDRALADGGFDAKLILQVHDELLIDCAAADAEQVMALVQEKMEHVVSLPVALTVDAVAGATWLQGH